MCNRRNMIFICLTISIIAICKAQQKFDMPNFNKPMSDEESLAKQQESIEVLMKQTGDMEMLLENYRRVIVNGLKESNDICSLIDGISAGDGGSNEINEKSFEKKTIPLYSNSNDMSINLYKQFFGDINDPILKTQLFAILENHIDTCYNQISVLKRDKNNLQKVRFHSWGGKRNRGLSQSQGMTRVVIRTPFHAWGGKRNKVPNEMSNELD